MVRPAKSPLKSIFGLINSAQPVNNQTVIFRPYVDHIGITNLDHYCITAIRTGAVIVIRAELKRIVGDQTKVAYQGETL